MIRRQPSLKWPLIIKPLIFHLLALVVAVFILLMLLVRADSGGYYTIQTFATVAAEAVHRGQDGALVVRMTPALSEALHKTPRAWFVAEDAQGRHVTLGTVPAAYASLIGNLGGVTHGDLRGRATDNGMSIVVRRHASPAGTITILAHGEQDSLTWQTVMAANVLALPIFILLALVTVIITPLIVKRSLVGVARIAEEAREISANSRGNRLTEAAVPVEIVPLVRAVNEALDRLDEEHLRQRRFVAAAAHELRTPIAILRLKVDAADDPTSRSLSVEVARLATLAEQLLDLHRLDGDSPQQEIDLAQLAKRVVADLAPLMIEADRSVSVAIQPNRPILGDAGAIERALSNLVQNAAEHGGRHILVRVRGTCIDVEDDGPGVPVEERQRVFEPFQRLRPRERGAGLGLNLVMEVVERHGGRVTILDSPGGGALFRVAFPPRAVDARGLPEARDDGQG